MPTPKLSNTINKSFSAIDTLNGYRSDSRSLEAKYQFFIAEIIMLRLFSIMEDSISEMAFKIAAGAKYLNETSPTLLCKANSVAGSRTLMLNYGRTKPIQNLKWTKSKHIKDSVEHVIDINNGYILYAQIHGAVIDEMRKVRNYIAHKSQSSKNDYKCVVRQTFGANSKIVPGAFLTSNKRSNTSKIDYYIMTSKIILNDMAKGL